MNTTTSPPVPDALRAIALPDIVTVEAYAEHTGQHPSTVRSHLRAGLLPGRHVGRRWLIARLALIAHLSRPQSREPNLRRLSDKEAAHGS